MRRKLPGKITWGKGFTLIELLVVITIIAVLAVIGMAIFSRVSTNAADASSRSDVLAMAKALENHYNPTSGAYSALQDSWFTDGSIPLPPEDYKVLYNPNNTGFQVCAALANHVGTADSCTPTDDTCFCHESTQGRFIAAGASAAPSSGPSAGPSASAPGPSPSASASPSPSPSPSASPSAPPATCTITAQNWSLTDVNEGTPVTISVSGDANCAGDPIEIQVWRNGVGSIQSNNLPDPINITTTTTAVWIAEYNSLFPFTDTQWYFKAIVDGNTYSSSTLVTVHDTNDPPAPTFNPVSGTCINAPLTGSAMTISWTQPNPPVGWVDISTDSGFGTFSNKQITSGSSTAAPTGFSGGLTIQPNVTYYVRLYNNAHGPTNSFTYPLCPPPSPSPSPSPVASPPPGNSGLLAEYWNIGSTNNWSTAPVVSRIDSFINSAVPAPWGNGSPIPGTINVDNFSIRWTGFITLPPGPAGQVYSFCTTTDDGTRLYVNNVLIINRWFTSNHTCANRTLDGGATYPYKLEYFEGGSTATAQALWVLPGQSEVIIPASAFTH